MIHAASIPHTPELLAVIQRLRFDRASVAFFQQKPSHLGCLFLAPTTPWIAAVCSFFTNSAVGLVKYGLTKPAGLPSLMPSLYSRLFRCCLRAVG